MALKGAMSRRNQAAVFIGEAQRRDVLRGLLANYYGEIQKEKLVFDTNRIWSAKLPALSQLFPKARVVCCVREVPWIMDSIERLVRGNAFERSGMFGSEPGNTVYTRVNRLATSEGMVGFALDALKEGFFGEQAPSLILVEYEALARAAGDLAAPLRVSRRATLRGRRFRPRPRHIRTAPGPTTG
jgi:sulfotransferase